MSTSMHILSSLAPQTFNPYQISDLATEYVTLVKEAANTSGLTGSHPGFIDLAEDQLVDFGFNKNLSPAVVERVASIFNSAKAHNFLTKNSSHDGATVLIDPRRVLEKFQKKGLAKKSSSSSSQSVTQRLIGIPDTNAPKSSEHRVVPTEIGGDVTGVVNFFSDEGGTVGDKPDILTETFNRLFKRASKDDGSNPLKGVPAKELEVLEAGYDRAIYEGMEKACSLVTHSDGAIDVPSFLRDIMHHRPDMLEVVTSFSRCLTKRGHVYQPKKNGRTRSFLEDYNGLTDQITSIYDNLTKKRIFDCLVKTANAPTSVDYEQQADPEGGGSGGKEGDKKEKGESDKILPLFGFTDAMASPPQQSGGESAKADAPAGLGLLSGMRDNVQGLLSRPPAAAPLDLVRAEEEAAAQSSYMQLLGDEVLSEYDPYEVEEAFNALRRYAPHLATDPMVARVTVRSMLQYDGLDPMTVKQFAESENERVRMLTNYRRDEAAPAKASS